MKRILLIATLAAATIVSACGNQAQNVTRAQTSPLGFTSFDEDADTSTSARSSFDLLSL